MATKKQAKVRLVGFCFNVFLGRKPLGWIQKDAAGNWNAWRLSIPVGPIVRTRAAAVAALVRAAKEKKP